MSRHELYTRAKEHLCVSRERRISSGRSQSLRRVIDGSELLNRSATLLPGVQCQQITTLREQNSSLIDVWSDESRRRAEAFHAGKWPLFSRECDLTDHVDWNTDPGGQYRWDVEFYADLPLYDLPPSVDVKYVWELGRHQFLAELGRDWLLNGVRRSATQAISLLTGWIESAPLYRGIHWTSALEVSTRSISWAWTLAFLHSYPDWKADDLDRIAATLEAHGEYLANHLSYYSSPYNHLIGEAAGLWLISQLLPNSASAEGWSALARRAICDFGPRQFHEDGFSVEQASSYHCYTLSFLAMVESMAQSANQPNFFALDERVQAAVDFAQALELPDGRLPMLGDADSARVCPILPDDYWDFRSVIEWVSQVFDRDCLRRPRSNSVEAYWWLGSRSLVDGETAEPAPTIRTVYPQSGYMIRREAQRYLLFDVGPIADGLFGDSTPSTAHGHADQLQLIVWNDDGELTYDVGMPHYGGDPSWTNYARSAAAHNTIELMESGPVRPGGRLEWSHHAPLPKSVAFSMEGIDFLVGQAYWPNVSVQRHIAVLPSGAVWVADHVSAETEVSAQVNWHLASADLDLQGWDQSGESASYDTPSTDHSSPIGWRFPAYGERERGVCRTFRSVSGKSHLLVSGLGCKHQSLQVRYGSSEVTCRLQADNLHFGSMALMPGTPWSWRFVGQTGEPITAQYVLPEQLTMQEFARANPDASMSFRNADTKRV